MIPADFWAALRAERFLVVGASELTGVPAARLFARMGVPFSVSDAAPREVLDARLAGVPVGRGDVHAGPQDPSQLRGVTQILVAPGVPRAIPLLAEARARGVPIWSDYDLLHPLYAHKRVAAVTGTDGKTTTTTLLAHLVAPDARVVVAGNMGRSVAAALSEILASDVVVIELSSFMLEDVKRFRADVSAVLNVAEDHVDRYPSIVEYEATKRAIVRYARRPDVFVRNLDDDRVARIEAGDLEVRTVSLDRADADAHARGGTITIGDARLSADRLTVRGLHHRSDVLVAASMAVAIGVPAPVAVERAASFPGVPHRFQLAFEAGGVAVIDDSKATSVQAVKRALESLADRHVVLIVGGRDKGLDPSPIAAERGHLRAVVGYGEAGARLLAAIAAEGGVDARYVADFDDAVEAACALARPGDALLLSPACTSFDQHADYVARGHAFRRVARRCLG